jgi:CBS domain-containing protein
MQTKLSVLLAEKGPTVHSISPEATVLDAVRRMNEQRIGSLLVTDGGAPVGIFSERDVLCRVVDQGRDPSATKVADVMTSELVTVRPDATVKEALGVVSEKRCRHLPVMSENQLAGMVSIGDLTHWLVRNQAFHIQDLVNYITRKYPA